MTYNIKNTIHKNDFGKDFHWGVSTSAFQIEGGHDMHGKIPSIWDKFTEIKGKIFNNEHAKTACNFYEHFEKDILLVKQLNIPNFRISIAWTRVFSVNSKAINPNGIAYYNQVIDFCIANDIEPWITLYHWDLPHELELKGGWANREILTWFADYVHICMEHFGDRVKNWMVLNEPLVFTGAGYFLGVHAPGKRGLKNFLPAMHHAVLCQAEGIRILKNGLKNANVGTTFSCSHITAHTDSEKDILAAKRIDTLVNRMFIEPLLGLGYPTLEPSINKKLQKYIYPQDAELMKANPDFIGIQNYTREVVKHHYFTPYLKAKLVSPQKRKAPTTLMNWEVYPEAIYQLLKKFDTYPQIKSIIITENGAAFTDHLEDGKVMDKERLDYIKKHLQQVLKAKNEGVKVDGYFVWSLLDNFEWAEGYMPRFGLVYVDFDNHKRTTKLSGFWYKNFLSTKNKSEAEFEVNQQLGN